jgi:molybdenum cofactor biosynthesis enzyme MoaA
MQIQTFSVLAGTAVCEAKCPFCVSKMTPDCGVTTKKININWDNFDDACRFAANGGVSTMLITGKGEPTLCPDDISEYIERGKKYFPFIELQTHGMNLLQPNRGCNEYVHFWRKTGLNTISLSCVHYLLDRNKEIYSSNYNELEETVEFIHNNSMSVRLSCVGIKGYIDNIDDLLGFVEYCKVNKVEQFTWRPVSNDVNLSELGEWKNDTKEQRRKRDVYENTNALLVSKENRIIIKEYFDKNATLVLELMHGAKVYSYQGQNVSISTCLTHEPDPTQIRQLIYFPDGHIRYSWTESGAIIL